MVNAKVNDCGFPSYGHGLVQFSIHLQHKNHLQSILGESIEPLKIVLLHCFFPAVFSPSAMCRLSSLKLQNDQSGSLDIDFVLHFKRHYLQKILLKDHIKEIWQKTKLLLQWTTTIYCICDRAKDEAEDSGQILFPNWAAPRGISNWTSGHEIHGAQEKDKKEAFSPQTPRCNKNSQNQYRA